MPSGTHISDSISWIERLIRGFGSPNTIYAAEICYWHKDVATCFTFGHNIGTPDFAATDCVLLWGNNPSATWLARAVEVNKALGRSARMWSSWIHGRQRWQDAPISGFKSTRTDQVLALGLAHLLIEKQAFNREFMSNWSNGPFLVRGDTGRFLRQSDIEATGRSEVLYACASESQELMPYDSARGIWLNQDTVADRAGVGRRGDRVGRLFCCDALGPLMALPGRAGMSAFTESSGG
jgi:anaerobic selenocysteine-containing dehydrogenase